MYTDTRPRYKYLFPDGRVAHVIRDHGDVAPLRVDFQLATTDALWPTAERRAGTTSRFIWLRLVDAAPSCCCHQCAAATRIARLMGAS